MPIPKSTDGKQRVLSLSYGKDSMACLGACEQLGWPIDRIITAEVWATDDIPADLPPMVAFKDYADKVIKERYGLEVEHYCATKNGEKLTYEKLFYHVPKRRYTNKKWGGHLKDSPASNGRGATENSKCGVIVGFPITGKGRSWCSDLKTKYLRVPDYQGAMVPLGSQAKRFLKAPLRKAQRQILCRC